MPTMQYYFGGLCYLLINRCVQFMLSYKQLCFELGSLCLYYSLLPISWCLFSLRLHLP